MQISESTRALALAAERELSHIFEDIDRIAREGTERVLDIFREERVSEGMFAASTGYGYGDSGRDAIDRIAAKIFGAEAGFMRPSIISGTHALTVGLFALLRPGDVMLSVTGDPYDTLREVIGMDGANGDGSLADFGVEYAGVEFTPDGQIDYPAIAARALREMVRQVGAPRFDEKGMLLRGVIVRHLVLPDRAADAMELADDLFATYGNRILFSVMNQYTPPTGEVLPVPLDCTLSEEEYDSVLAHLEKIGMVRVYAQEGGTVSESFIPDFNGEGV